MSRATEKVMKQLIQYMEDHQDELDSGTSEQELTQRFMDEYNAIAQAGDRNTDPQTADDYIELAEEATTKKAKLEYLSKALQLEPDNLDAAHMVAETKAKNLEDMFVALSALIEKGNALMEKQGFFQNAMGKFWGYVETRPYMRVRYAYLETLIQCGMMEKAVSEAEELLKLCEDDNLGVRVELMHLYAHLEKEDEALALHQKYGAHDETQMLLPLAVLYYKKADFERSVQYLQRLSRSNKDTRRFVRAVKDDAIEAYLDVLDPHGYEVNSIQELLYDYLSNIHLFDSAKFFFDWAYRSLKKTTAQAGTAQTTQKSKTTQRKK